MADYWCEVCGSERATSADPLPLPPYCSNCGKEMKRGPKGQVLQPNTSRQVKELKAERDAKDVIIAEAVDILKGVRKHIHYEGVDKFIAENE